MKLIEYAAWAATIVAFYADVRPIPMQYTAIMDYIGWDHWAHAWNSAPDGTWQIVAAVNALYVAIAIYLREK